MLVTVGTCMSAGCTVIAFFAQGIADHTVKAEYILPDRPTLVLVDDPTDQLADPSLPNLVAHHVGANLTKQSVLTDPVAPEGLIEVQARLGKDYPRTPIDRVGRELGAQQVIFVYVRSITLSPEPGLFRPTATVDVKVIDAQRGTRLFPAVPDADPTTPQPPPYRRIISTMPYKTAPDFGRETLRLVRRSLCQRIGRDVARLFHDHEPRNPGDGFDS